MLAFMLQNLEASGCLGAESSALTFPLSANQQTDRTAVLTGTVFRLLFVRKLFGSAHRLRLPTSPQRGLLHHAQQAARPAVKSSLE